MPAYRWLVLASLLVCGFLVPLNIYVLSPHTLSSGLRAKDTFLKPSPSSSPQPAAKDIAANIWGRAWNSAFRGGVAGFSATVLQVICLMWLRTVNNYQNVHGCGLRAALNDLYQEGGVARLYQGVSFAIFQSPLAKSGMTAAYAGVPILLEVYMPRASQSTVTAIASVCAASWKAAIMPVEVIKTMKQVKGKDANAALWSRVQEFGLSAFYVGLPVTFLMNFVGTYPFLMVFSTLNLIVPSFDRVEVRMLKNGIIGMIASLASDVCSNPFKVLKTVQQCSSDNNFGLPTAVKRVVESDGIISLFGRGLLTRLLVNALQGSFFTVVWRFVEDHLKDGTR